MDSILNFLGSDAGFGDRNNSAYYESQKKLILIDCGYTVFNIAKSKFYFAKYNDIDIVITHLHNDHAGSLSQLILYIYYKYNKKVNVISKCRRIKDYLDITGVPACAYSLNDSSNEIKFALTKHSEEMDCYGFAGKFEDKKIVYTGDTATLEPFKPLLHGASELYVDVSKAGGVHIKIDEVYEELENIKKEGTNVFLMHIDDRKYVKGITKSDFEIIE